MFTYMKMMVRSMVKDERGEGMVGWIVAALLTVAIVVAIHGMITGWLPTFWTRIQGRMDSIV
jgi:Flp pilus assembly pilin Flp